MGNLKKLQSAVFSLIILAMFCASIIFSDAVSREISSGIHICLYVIIPSLYGAMVCACMITESGLHHIIGKLLSPAAKYIFRLRPEIFAVFIISNISGYPVGAKLLSDLRKKGEITDREFDSYISFCYASGPAFVAGTAAAQIYRSFFAGMVIFSSIITANNILVFISSFKRSRPCASHIITTHCDDHSSVVLSSVNNAAGGMFQMCIMIIAFSMIRGILSELGVIGFLSALVSEISGMSHQDSAASFLSFIEISNVTRFTFMDYNNMPLIAALLSFGGLCVILQVFAIANNRIAKLRFFLYRLAGSILTYFICRAACLIFADRFVISTASYKILSKSSSALPSVILIIMSVLLISQKAIDKTSSK
ncbi:MAG: hypothetical protein Q4F95_12065 [Oscillospiraceae bacterium]|nr:hypothetical protein [Oscillospiraceae bacterium]